MACALQIRPPWACTALPPAPAVAKRPRSLRRRPSRDLQIERAEAAVAAAMLPREGLAEIGIIRCG
jgi:hypothetical protein